MRIDHLALQVRDPRASCDFYVETLGLEARITPEDGWGIDLAFADGLMLALIQGEPLPRDVIGRVHFGCSFPDPAQVVALRERLRGAGVSEVEWSGEPGYVSVKVEDPDGYVVELYYEE